MTRSSWSTSRSSVNSQTPVAVPRMPDDNSIIASAISMARLRQYEMAPVNDDAEIWLVTLATATLFVPVSVDHPLLMLLFLAAISIGFSLLGFVIGIWAQNFEQLQVVPMLVVTPLTFLGGIFYSIGAIGEPWRTITHLNPILYLVSGFRWTFFGIADVPLEASVAIMAAAIVLPLAATIWIFRTGYRLKS